MRSDPRTAAEVDLRLSSLADELAQLRDLFQRRLFDDKAKGRLYEQLCDELSAVRAELAQQSLAPLFRELLMLIDRISCPDRGDDAAIASVIVELTEILERRDVRRVPAVGQFDPRFHEAVRADVRDDQPAGAILEVVRPGYFLGTRLLRPERVVVAAEGLGDASEPGLTRVPQ